MLAAGQRVRLAKDIVLEVLEVVVPSEVLALEGDGLARQVLGGVCSLRVAPRPEIVPGFAGDADAVRRLLDLGFGVDAVDAQGCPGLRRAAGGGHLAAVEPVNEIARNATFGTGAYPSSPSATFNQVTAVGDPRTWQLALRLRF